MALATDDTRTLILALVEIKESLYYSSTTSVEGLFEKWQKQVQSSYKVDESYKVLLASLKDNHELFNQYKALAKAIIETEDHGQLSVMPEDSSAYQGLYNFLNNHLEFKEAIQPLVSPETGNLAVINKKFRLFIQSIQEKQNAMLEQLEKERLLIEEGWSVFEPNDETDKEGVIKQELLQRVEQLEKKLEQFSIAELESNYAHDSEEVQALSTEVNDFIETCKLKKNAFLREPSNESKM